VDTTLTLKTPTLKTILAETTEIESLLILCIKTSQDQTKKEMMIPPSSQARPTFAKAK